MDTAVALVQAYLNLNGYFTVVEYPVLEAFHHRNARTVTDLDVLAFRFPGAGHEVIRGRERAPMDRDFESDPVLECPADRPDMIVGEVKEGQARFNPATRDPAVIEIALARFGCCPRKRAASIARQLLSRGHAETPTGHTVRMVAFGMSSEDGEKHRWLMVPMGHVAQYLQGYLREHWDILRHAQIKEPALGFLSFLEKCAVQNFPENS